MRASLIPQVLATSALAVACAASIQAATLDPLSSFGSGDGWRSTGEVLAGDSAGTTDVNGKYNYLRDTLLDPTGGNTERGLAYNAATGHLLLVSRSSAGNGIRILDGTSGADLGSLNQGAGIIAGGLFTTNMVATGDDGAVYVANLTIDSSAPANPFKVYRWSTEASAAPTVAYSGVTISGTRIGDTFDAIGSGTSTRLAAGFSNTPNVSGNNSFTLFTTADGSSYAATPVAIGGNPPSAGDFRLGITFKDADTVIGRSSTASNLFARIVDVQTDNTGLLAASYQIDGSTLNPLDYATIQGKQLMAVLNTADDQLWVYDISDYFTYSLVAKAKIATTHNSNGNGTGQVKFGAIVGNVATIYALDTNNGIQAFRLTLDPQVVPGDYNGDLVVDAADYTVWRDTFGSISDLRANGDNTGISENVVDQTDFIFWKSHFGIPGSGGVGATPIPEPPTIAIAFAAVGFLAVRWRSRH